MTRTSLLSAALATGVALALGGCAAGGTGALDAARNQYSSGDLSGALASVETVLRTDSTNADALDLKAGILARQADAARTVEEAAAKARMSADTYRRLAANPLRRIQAENQIDNLYRIFYGRGGGYYNRAIQSPDSTSLWISAADYMMLASSVAPDSAGANRLAGYALLRGGRTPEAITQLRLAADKGTPDASLYVALGQAYLQQGRTEASAYNDAISVLEGAAQRFPSDEDIQALLLNAYRAAGRMDDAMRGYASRIQANPNDPALRLIYGTLLLQSDNYAGAVEQLTAATTFAPTNADAHYNLGAAYTNQAAAVNRRINEMEDALTRDRARLSAAERNTRRAEIDALVAQRRGLFTQAITPLARARELYTADGKDVRNVCTALFQAYSNVGQTDRAMSVRDCAGLN